MAQLSYSQQMEIGSVGLLADCGFKNVLSPRAFEDIPIGRGVVKVVGEDMGVRLPGQNYSTIVLNADLVTGNLIQTSINGTLVGVQNSVIDFDIDFVALNSIVATINGVALPAVVFNTDQATTMSDLATAIALDAAVASATVTGLNQITVVFAAAGDNTVDSVVTSLGATQPTATISEGSVFFATSHLATMQAIADEIALVDGIASATVGGAGNRTIFVNAEFSGPLVVDSFTVSLGASQATATITDTTADTFYGVALRVQNKMNLLDPSVGSDGAAPYYEGEAVSMLTRGRVYVYVETAVSSDDAVYMRFVAGGAGEEVGQFRANDAGGDAILVAGARWIYGAAAGGLAVLEINMP